MPEVRDRQRAQRILDAAAELVLRWGSKRVTIEEVAKHAGVGKGTVYLHFESRAWLFMCVVMRESVDLIDELVASITRDPAAVLLAEQVRLTFLGVQRRPLLRAMSVRDIELLGELAHEGAIEPLRDLRGGFAEEFFVLMREHGLLRTDLDIDTQQHVVGAVQTGFYMYEPVPGAPESDPGTTASALSHTLRAAVQHPGAPDPAALAAVVPTVLAMYERLRAGLEATIAAQPVKASQATAATGRSTAM
jgi:AcrR family transcriptional regulator